MGLLETPSKLCVHDKATTERKGIFSDPFYYIPEVSLWITRCVISLKASSMGKASLCHLLGIVNQNASIIFRCTKSFLTKFGTNYMSSPLFIYLSFVF